MGPDVVRRADPSAVGAILAGHPRVVEAARTRELYLAQGFVAMTGLQRIDWNGATLILARPL
jgi:hypothetical protein